MVEKSRVLAAALTADSRWRTSAKKVSVAVAQAMSATGASKSTAAKARGAAKTPR